MLWLDGEQVSGDRAEFDLRDRGLLLGDGAFDTSLAINGQIVFGARHAARLAHTCAVLGLPVAETDIAAQLDMAAVAVGTGTVRLTVTRGVSERGLMPPEQAQPRLILSATPAGPSKAWQPVRVVTANARRNETSVTAQHKCLGYLDAILELSAAAGRGADEVLFLNTAGRVSCFGTGNVFAIHGTTLTTPPVEDGVLNGVTRDMLLALAPESNLTVAVASLSPEELHGADAVFMTNSLRLMAPVTHLDDTALSTTGTDVLRALRQGLATHIQNHHGASAWTEERFATWPVPR